jgi:hypothetical protein
METAENKKKTSRKRTNLMLRSYFNSKISHAVDCTNMHCQGVDRSESRNPILKKEGRGGASIHTACKFI